MVTATVTTAMAATMTTAVTVAMAITTRGAVGGLTPATHPLRMAALVHAERHAQVRVGVVIETAGDGEARGAAIHGIARTAHPLRMAALVHAVHGVQVSTGAVVEAASHSPGVRCYLIQLSVVCDGYSPTPRSRRRTFLRVAPRKEPRTGVASHRPDRKKHNR